MRNSRTDWVAVAFALTTGCATSQPPSESEPAAAGSGEGGGVQGSRDGGPDGSGGSWVLPSPTQDAELAPVGSSCGTSSFVAEQIVIDKLVEVPQEITEQVTEVITENVTELETVEVTTVKPAALYIMFDQSASMSGATGSGNLWTPAVAALKSFVADDASAGLRVGLQYFPLSGGSCSDGSGYATPDVSVGLLPGHAGAISASLDRHSAGGIGTPIEGALRGVTGYCERYQADHPGEQCVAVLVTDGEPEYALGCSENDAFLADIATTAHAHGVITFAVGLKGANFGLLDKIAQQGGAPDCDAGSARYACDISGGADKLSLALASIREHVVTTETHTVTRPVMRTVTHPVTRTVTHTEYRNEIQKTPVPCEWGVPESETGEAFDRDKVNIRWSASGAPRTLVRVDSAQACREDAWYFDDPSQPTRFIACAQTCQAITADPTSQVDIVLGCATIVPG